jgi:nitroreductase
MSGTRLSSTSLLSLRRSTPARLLGPPGPDSDQLRQLLAWAVRVPDHGRLAPWRFLCIRGEVRHRLGERLAIRALERDTGASEASVEKDRRRFSHAPLIVAVIAHLQPGHKIPEQEQLLSGGAVCFSLLLGAQELGFGAQWLTGWPAYDPEVARWLDLGEHERILGFIHMGTPTEAVPERERPSPDELLGELEL